MYASIDFVTDRLARKLVKYKERRLDGYHGGPNMGENLAEVLNELDESDESKLEQLDAVLEEEAEQYVDPEAPVVTKVKRCVFLWFIFYRVVSIVVGFIV